MKVCIDPGHAAHTPGKRSFDGAFREYAFNRAVAEALADYLQSYGVEWGYSCDIAQAEDVSVRQRAEWANRWQADIFISIHGNAFGEHWNEVRGWEAFIAGVGGASEHLAQCIQAASIPYLGLTNRGIKVADFAVLRLTHMPAVLVEHGFFTNRGEMQLMQSAAFQKQCAIANGKGILHFLAQREKGML